MSYPEMNSTNCNANQPLKNVLTGALITKLLGSLTIVLGLDLRSKAQEEIHDWYCKFGQNPKAEKIIGSKGNSLLLFC